MPLLTEKLVHTLMDKNIDVVQLVIDEDAVAITEIGKLLTPDHLPLGCKPPEELYKNL